MNELIALLTFLFSIHSCDHADFMGAPAPPLSSYAISRVNMISKPDITYLKVFPIYFGKCDKLIKIPSSER